MKRRLLAAALLLLCTMVTAEPVNQRLFGLDVRPANARQWDAIRNLGCTYIRWEWSIDRPHIPVEEAAARGIRIHLLLNLYDPGRTVCAQEPWTKFLGRPWTWPVASANHWAGLVARALDQFREYPNALATASVGSEAATSYWSGQWDLYHNQLRWASALTRQRYPDVPIVVGSNGMNRYQTRSNAAAAGFFELQDFHCPSTEDIKGVMIAWVGGGYRAAWTSGARNTNWVCLEGHLRPDDWAEAPAFYRRMYAELIGWRPVYYCMSNALRHVLVHSNTVEGQACLLVDDGQVVHRTPAGQAWAEAYAEMAETLVPPQLDGLRRDVFANLEFPPSALKVTRAVVIGDPAEVTLTIANLSAGRTARPSRVRCRWIVETDWGETVEGLYDSSATQTHIPVVLHPPIPLEGEAQRVWLNSNLTPGHLWLTGEAEGNPHTITVRLVGMDPAPDAYPTTYEVFVGENASGVEFPE